MVGANASLNDDHSTMTVVVTLSSLQNLIIPSQWT